METRDTGAAANPDQATQRWFDDFTVELRMLDVPGDAVGDAVASAREFLTDSGDTPQEAFGHPREYAESLDLPRSPASPSAMAALLVPTCLGLLGFFAVAAAVSSADASVRVTLSGLLLVLSGLALAACAPLLMGFLIRGSVWRAGISGAAVFSAQLVLGLLAGEVVLFTLPAVPTALTGGTVLLATSLWAQFRTGTTDDPIRTPLSPAPHSSFGLTLLEVLGNWMLFLAAAAVSAWFLLRG